MSERNAAMPVVAVSCGGAQTGVTWSGLLHSEVARERVSHRYTLL